MPKLDPYPTSPWSSELPYGGHNNCQSPAHATSSTCWGKAKGSFRNCKSGSMRSTQESINQLTEKTEAVSYDKFSPYYRELMDGSIFEYHSPGRESHSIATTSTSVGSSFFLRMWEYSCFHTKSEFASSSVQKTLGRREPAETSLTNEKKKKKLDVASMKDETSSNKKMKEKAPAEAEQIQTTTMNFKEEKPKEVRKFNWADKYQPKTLRDFICHQDKAYMLQSLVQSGQSNHFIFEGAPGVGKRTMTRALLREVFEPNMLETREALKDFKLKGGPISSIQINVKMSSCHIEVNLSDIKKRQVDRVAMELIKESSAVTLNENQLQSDYTSKTRAIILCGAEKLSENAQLHIRNHLEDCRGQFKVYFCYSGTSMLQNLKSLCTVVQIPTPSKEEIIEVLEFIAKHEAIELPPKLAENIAEKAKHNVRQAIRSFEATWQSNYPFREDQELVTGWEEELAEIAKNVIEEQSPKQMFVIKEKIKNLMVHNAPPEIIFETLVGELKKLLDNELLLIISDLCQQDECYFDCQNLSYQNAISDEMIEEFVAKFMSAYQDVSQHQQQID